MLVKDVGYAMRALIRSPVFAWTAVTVLGVSIAACTVTFGLINAVYFRALPYHDPDRVVLVGAVTAGQRCPTGCPVRVAPEELAQWGSQLAPLANCTDAVEYWGVLSTSAETTMPVGAAVPATFFPMLGIRPMMGRVFEADDDRPGAAGVMVISQDVWRRSFGSDTGVTRISVTLDGRPYRIIGVLSSAQPVGPPVVPVDDPRLEPTVPFFIPRGSSEIGAPGRPGPDFHIICRLRAQATARELASRASTLLSAADTSGGRVATAVVMTARHAYSLTYGGSYPLFLGAVLIVMAVACLNLSGLFLARLSARRREIAIRSAVGANGARLIRQFATEGVLLAMVGGVLGIGLSFGGILIARALPTGNVPYWTRVVLDWRVLLFAFGMAGLCGPLFAVGPAIIATMAPLTESMRGGAGASDAGRRAMVGQQILVSVEIAGTLVLLTCAGLLGTTFLSALQRDVGMVKHSLIIGGLSVRGPAYQMPANRVGLIESLIERLQRLPNVTSVAVRGSAAAPAPEGLTLEGDTTTAPITPAPDVVVVSPGYFGTLGNRVARGREFTALDVSDAPAVVMLSAPTAQRLFQGADPIGRRIKLGPASSPEPWLTIVGVAEEGQPLLGPRTPSSRATLFRPLAQAPPSDGVGFRVRVHGPSNEVLPNVRAVFRRVAPTLPLLGLTTIEEASARQLAPLRMNASVLAVFAGLTLVIVILGVGGVMAFVVTRRTPEIAVRMALGARSGDVLLAQLRAVGIMTGVGVLAGLAASFVISQGLRSMLYGTSPTDPRAFVAAVSLLVAAALGGGYVPARRATRTDPATALRNT